jgi:hypothetical protein
VSELNRDPKCPIRILNETVAGRNDRGEPCERSVYWSERSWSEPCSELRSEQRPHTESDFVRRHRKEEASSLPLFAGVSR